MTQFIILMIIFIVIHGVAEQKDDGEETDGDKKFVDVLVKTIKIPTPNIKSISRIGTKAANKKRPIKVVLGSEKEKMALLRNLAALKGSNKYIGVSVTEDLTQTERLLLKEWADKAKKSTQEDPNWIWRVRGDSKNGYYHKKFPRKQNQ